MGITGPHIVNAERAQKLADACRYVPRGLRSFGSGRGAYFGDVESLPGYMEHTNDNILVIAQLEDVQVLDNIADILAFEDPDMPRIQADNVSAKKVKITREQVLAARQANPGFDKYQLAALLGCSEQTIDRRLKNNNVRGGKYAPQTRVQLTAGLVEQWATDAGFYLYDRRVWVKDPCWENSRWHSLSYRSVDEWEHLLIFWKPGITVVNRERLDAGEWAEWGSRSVWQIASVHSNSAHESQFPIELPRRMIKLLTEPDDLVLDCFLGSGTTALAAIEQGRRFMGFDISGDSVRLAEKRVAEALDTARMLL